VSPVYAGLDWDLIDAGEYQWPVPEKGHPGTPVLHEGEFKNGTSRVSYGLQADSLYVNRHTKKKIIYSR